MTKTPLEDFFEKPTNLLDETIQAIKKVGKSLKDVAWVGSNDGKYAMSFMDFADVASVNYNAGYGRQEIATDLVIVFFDGSWLSRDEYDGMEWWRYNTAPQRKDDAKPFKYVKAGDEEGWVTLASLNMSDETN